MSHFPCRPIIRAGCLVLAWTLCSFAPPLAAQISTVEVDPHSTANSLIFPLRAKAFKRWLCCQAAGFSSAGYSEAGVAQLDADGGVAPFFVPGDIAASAAFIEADTLPVRAVQRQSNGGFILAGSLATWEPRKWPTWRGSTLTAVSTPLSEPPGVPITRSWPLRCKPTTRWSSAAFSRWPRARRATGSRGSTPMAASTRVSIRARRGR